MSKYRVGNWKVVCDVCGFTFLNTEVRKRWDGLIVCEQDFERKHPSLTPVRLRESPAPPFVRPEPEDSFIAVCTEEGRTSITGFAVAGCWVAGYVSKAVFGSYRPQDYNSYTWDTAPITWDAWDAWG